MTAAHLAYTDLAVDKFSGTDNNQDVESFVQLIERKINFALEMPPQTPNNWPTTFSTRKRSFLLHLEVQLPNGMKAMWKLLPHGKISE